MVEVVLRKLQTQIRSDGLKTQTIDEVVVTGGGGTLNS